MQGSSADLSKKDIMKFVSGSLLRRCAVTLCALLAVWAGSMAALAVFVPDLIRSRAEAYVASLGRHLTLGQVSLEPWSMTLRLEQVALSDKDGSLLFSAKRVAVNTTPTALLVGQWRAKSFSFDTPRLTLRRERNGSWNLARFLQDAAGPDAADSGTTPSVIVDELDIRHAAIAATDLGAPNGEADWHVGELTLNLVNLSTQARDGNYALTAGMPDGTRLAWHGTLNLQPFDSFGEAKIEGLPVADLWPYLGSQLAIKAPRGRLSAEATYHLSLRGAKPKLTLSPLTVSLADFKAETPDGRSMAALKTFRLEDGIFDLAKQSVFFKRARLMGGDLNARRDRSGRIDWQAAIKPGPALTSSPSGGGGWKFRVADITAEGWHLNVTDESFVKPLTLDTGIASLTGSLQLTPDDGISLNRMTARLAGLSLASAGRDPWFRLDELSVSQSDIREKDRQIAPGNVTLNGLSVSMLRNAAGRLETLDDLRRVPLPGARARNTDAAKGWNVVLPDVALADGAVRLTDKSLPSPLSVDLNRMTGQLLSDDDGQLAYSLTGMLGGGNVDVEGMLRPEQGSLHAVVKTRSVPLALFAPYVLSGKPLRLAGGTLATRLDISAGRDKALVVRGEASADSVYLYEKGVAKPLVGWRSLKAKGLDLRPASRVWSVSDVLLEQPEARLTIEENRKLNLARLLSRPEAPVREDAAPAATDAGPGAIRVKAIHIARGDIEFADHSMQPAFSSRIHHLRGSLTGFSNEPGHSGVVTLDGGVDRYGDVKVRGRLVPTKAADNSEFSLVFRNVPMNSLNPYSMNFAGWKIEDGRLGVTLHYTMKDQRLDGDNRIVIQSIRLGDEVTAPGVSRLPLRLAVAVLEDSDRRIDLNVPVHGNLNDPSFSYGHLVWQAIGNVIRKVVTAPFRALGALLGKEGFDTIRFVPGEAGLAPPEREKLEELGQMLARRPQLSLQLGGGYDDSVDLRAMARARVDRAILKVQGFSPAHSEPLPEPDVSATETQEAVRTVFAARVGRLTLLARRLSPSAPSGAAFARQLREEMISRESIPSSDLAELANERVAAAHKLLLGTHPELASRVTVLPPAKLRAEEAGVPLKLELGTAPRPSL
ncbi:DUF748 domain-containing protein [Paludibacterium paludis]|uniref:DUF748 domain-containing protein n=1 Tax=Paludibacterium paludis TaxID=1225769 RepID=A0A918P0R2_9NEIS|nr:DUF748 domain-containing protein [Paludibacterium paludis]GGY10717.1 hypothetical protein GCM10011289_11860 [Paludibacterium paludis]